MLWQRFVVSMFLFSALALDAGVTSGQSFPNKPLRIVTGTVGGGSDFAARLITPGLADSLRQPVIVENRPPLLTAELASKATPDGYTLLVTGSSFWFGPLLQKAPYDPMKDFSPVTLSGTSPNILIVHPSVAATSVKELIALAKAKPGALNYASGPIGSANHLAAELFKHMAGVNIVRIAYKGGGPAFNDLLAGQVQVLFASAGSVIPHLKSGRVRALAITSPQPSRLAPDLPTMADAGLPGYQLVSPDSVFVPAKTPATIIKRLNEEIVRVISRADVKENFFNTGVEVVGSSPGELSAFMKSDIATWSEVIKAAGIRPE